jgi:hypothetical protein
MDVRETLGEDKTWEANVLFGLTSKMLPKRGMPLGCGIGVDMTIKSVVSMY